MLFGTWIGRYDGEIDAYKSDYLHDRIFLVKYEPKVFVWVIRDSGTHIYSLDDPSVTEGVRRSITPYPTGCDDPESHKKNDNIVGVFAFYEDIRHGSASMTQFSSQRVTSCRAATRVVRNND